MIPRPYQLVGRDFLAARTRALLADQMRLGKSGQAIMAADKVGAERILVLCPAIATAQWRDQWTNWSERPPAAVLGREPPPSGFTGVLIASYNRAVQHREALTASPRWDVLVVDEAHFAKNPTAQRTRAVYGKGGIGWNSTCIWSLTGTPVLNHPGELWPMLRAFGVTQMSYMDFVRHFCYYSERDERIYGARKEHTAELRGLLAACSLRRTLGEVAPELPPISYNMLAIEPVKGVDLHIDVPEGIDPEERIDVAMAKVPALAKEIAECIGAGDYSQTVVFGWHVEPLHRLATLLEAAGIDAGIITGATPDMRRQKVQATFKAGVCQVLVAQIIAAGTAIDLSAAQHGYFLELDWTPSGNAQAAHRLVNVQTKLPVTMDILTWPGTMDDRVQRTLLRKMKDIKTIGLA